MLFCIIKLTARRSKRGDASEADPVKSPPTQRRRVDASPSGDRNHMPSSPAGSSQLISSPGSFRYLTHTAQC